MTIVCAFASGVLVRLALWVVSQLELLGPQPSAPRGWMWPVTDAWSLTADVGVPLARP